MKDEVPILSRMLKNTSVLLAVKRCGHINSLSKATEREREVVTDSIARSVLNNVINDKILPLGCSI